MEPSSGVGKSGLVPAIDLTSSAAYGRPMSMILENARIVLRDRVIEGWVACDGALISAVGEGEAPGRGIDLAGDTLIPGLVELHTDALEGHVKPRPKVRWHLASAVQAYDAQI